MYYENKSNIPLLFSEHPGVYKFGISDSTKIKMKERDKARQAASEAMQNEKQTLLTKYKILRNICNPLTRRECKEAAAKRILDSNDPAVIWRHVSDVLNPRRPGCEKIEGNSEEDIANKFNELFVDKVQKLKQNINPALKSDPTQKLKEKMRGRGSFLRLHPVSEKEVAKAIRGLKSKKSSGFDGVSQELLKSLSSVITLPLKTIINA